MLVGEVGLVSWLWFFGAKNGRSCINPTIVIVLLDPGLGFRRKKSRGCTKNRSVVLRAEFCVGGGG